MPKPPVLPRHLRRFRLLPALVCLPSLQTTCIKMPAHGKAVSNSIQFRANLCFLSASPQAPSQRPNPMTASSEQPHAPRRPGRVSSPAAAGHAPTCSATGVSPVACGDAGTRSRPCSAKRCPEGSLTRFCWPAAARSLCPEALGVSGHACSVTERLPSRRTWWSSRTRITRERPRHRPEAPNQ